MAARFFRGLAQRRLPILAGLFYRIFRCLQVGIVLFLPGGASGVLFAIEFAERATLLLVDRLAACLTGSFDLVKLPLCVGITLPLLAGEILVQNLHRPFGVDRVVEHGHQLHELFTDPVLRGPPAGNQAAG